MHPGLVHRRVTIAAVVSLAAFAALMTIALTPALQGLDRELKVAVDGVRHPLLEVTMRTVTFVGDGWTLLVFTAVTSLVLLRAGDRLARRVPLIMLGSAMAEWLVKFSVARRRPRGGPFAFPSGHVFTSVAFFGLMIYLLWTRDVPRPWRLAGTLACVLIVGGIAVSRIYLRFHWLTDVLGGVTGGAAYLLIALAFADRPAREASGSA
jgi:undecaprenyl-diphosphatase